MQKRAVAEGAVATGLHIGPKAASGRSRAQSLDGRTATRSHSISAFMSARPTSFSSSRKSV